MTTTPTPSAPAAPAWTPSYSPWRHGGWYVDNVRYPSGAVGCVSRNYADRKWRIVCDPRPFDAAPTYPNRDAAASAERALADEMTADRETHTTTRGPLTIDECAITDRNGPTHEVSYRGAVAGYVANHNDVWWLYGPDSNYLGSGNRSFHLAAMSVADHAARASR